MTIRLSSALSAAEYHGSPGVTFHRLKDFLNNGPRYYRGRHILRDTAPPPEKDWGSIGSAYHIYALEGEQAFLEQVVSTPATYLTEAPVVTTWNTRKKYCQEWAKTNPGAQPPATFLDGDPQEEKPWNANANACRAWLDRVKPGTVILSPEDYSAAKAIGRNTRANKHAARLLGMGWPEITIEQSDPRFPVPMKGRIDWLASTSTNMQDAWAIVDPKGTVEIDRFQSDALRYGYHRQMAYYRSLVFHEIGKLLPVFLLAVEKTGAHRCRVWQVDPELLDIANAQNEADLDRLGLAYASDEWPLDHDDSIRVLPTPEWMKPRNEDGKPAITAPWDMP